MILSSISMMGVASTYISYVDQEPDSLGLAHAVRCARDSLRGEEDFVVMLGDVLVKLDMKKIVKQHISNGAKATIALATVKDPRPFGVVTLNDDLKVNKLVEKPRVPASNYVVAGLYIFNQAIFDTIESLKLSWRGEYELTDAM